MLKSPVFGRFDRLSFSDDLTGIGLLQRHICIDQIKYIGKESNHLEDVDAELINSAEDIYTNYVDKSRDDWQTKILPILRRLTLAYLICESGRSRRVLLDIRAGRCRPAPEKPGLSRGSCTE